MKESMVTFPESAQNLTLLQMHALMLRSLAMLKLKGDPKKANLLPVPQAYQESLAPAQKFRLILLWVPAAAYPKWNRFGLKVKNNRGFILAESMLHSRS